MKQRAERLIKELQELIGEVLYAKGREDIFHKVAQLKAVHESIEQLEAKDIMVPDDLRRLKVELLSETGKNRESFEILDYLATELKKLEKELRVHIAGKKSGGSVSKKGK